MIQGRQIADPMGVTGEDGRDGRAEVVPNSRGTEGPDLTDGVAPRGDAIDEAGLDESTQHVGRRLGRELQGVLDLRRREGCTPLASKLVQKPETSISCHGCPLFTFYVYLRQLRV